MIETDFFSTYFLPGVLALIMMGMGLSLTAEDFKRILLHPGSVIVGLISQMILLPATAIALAILAGDFLSNEMKVGLVLVSACPGGTTAGLMSHLLKGNVALSVSITTVNSLLTIITIPLITNWAMVFFMGEGKQIELPFGEMMVHVLVVLLLPCLLGVIIRANKPEWAHKLEGPLKPLMAISLGIAILAAMFLEKKQGPQLEFQQFFSVFPWAFLLNLGGMFFGLWSSKLIRLDLASGLTIGLETGLQNTGLAIFIATSSYLLADATYAVPAATYAMFSLITAGLFGLYVQRGKVGLKDMFGT
jgi:BASS family bile acid:Na+ symporter